MHVDDSPRSRLLMKVVNVLRADKKTPVQIVFPLCKSEMGFVRLRRQGIPPTDEVELPNEPGIVATRIGRGDLFNSILAPQPARITKGSNAAFRAYPRAGVKQLLSAIAGTGCHGGSETLSPERTVRQLSKLRAGQTLQKAGALT
jgi:hypothetical protein